MKYNTHKNHRSFDNAQGRRSIRLKGYNYSKPGGYFVTLCVNKKLCLFGDIINGNMNLNDVGKMIDKWWRKLIEKFENIKLDEYKIMPNHMHGIIRIVGADSNVCPKYDDNKNQTIQGEHMDSPLQINRVPLSKIMQWFETMSTNEYIRNVKQNNWEPFYKKLWQQNYYACADEYR
jgi:REP element-mobilizing transposase RayT